MLPDADDVTVYLTPTHNSITVLVTVPEHVPSTHVRLSHTSDGSSDIHDQIVPPLQEVTFNGLQPSTEYTCAVTPLISYSNSLFRCPTSYYYSTTNSTTDVPGGATTPMVTDEDPFENSTFGTNTTANTTVSTTDDKDSNLLVILLASIIPSFVSLLLVGVIILIVFCVQPRQQKNPRGSIAPSGPPVLPHHYYNNGYGTTTDWSAFSTSSDYQTINPSCIQMSPYEQPVDNIELKVTDFDSYIKQNFGALNEEFNEFPTYPMDTMNVGKHASNAAKSRSDCFTYDGNRVVLTTMGDDFSSDFISASRVAGYENRTQYVAAETPLAATRVDMWRMIWELNIEVALMLESSHDDEDLTYWPSSGAANYLDIRVEAMASLTQAFYVKRTFQVSCRGEYRTLTHLSYKERGDSGVMLHDLLDLRSTVKSRW